MSADIWTLRNTFILFYSFELENIIAKIIVLCSGSCDD